ncbi:unnamed protein product [Victoria cruziana]
MLSRPLSRPVAEESEISPWKQKERPHLKPSCKDSHLYQHCPMSGLAAPLATPPLVADATTTTTAAAAVVTADIKGFHHH